jgi:cholest-4-en-3-one 26-monooxygenase
MSVVNEFRFDEPDQYVGGTPYDEFARLRKQSPFAWHQASGDPSDGFWLVTKHHDVVTISKNPKLFATHAPLLADPLPREMWPQCPALAMIADNVMTMEHQKHLCFRPMVNGLFSGAHVARFEAQVRAICVDKIGAASGRGRFDFAHDVALAVPVAAILGLFLGIPREDQERVARCVLVINAMDDPVFRPRREALLDAADELYAYGIALSRRLRAAPNEGVLSQIVYSTLADLPMEQFFLTYWFPLTAGAFDTTASTIAGGVLALLRYPEQLARLRADPALIPLAVEEMLRWVSPVVYFRRTATSDVECNGHRIKRGQKVVLCYASANRDEDVFVNGDCFDVARSPNNHVSFGHGPHYCLGARLAGSVIRIFLEEFLQRMPPIQSDGAVVHTRSAWMNRIRAMPVRLA